VRAEFLGSGKRVAIYTNAPTAALAAAELMFLLWKARDRDPTCYVFAYGDIDSTFPLAEWAAGYKSAEWALLKRWAGIR
jgi:hypothetical protein